MKEALEFRDSHFIWTSGWAVAAFFGSLAVSLLLLGSQWLSCLFPWWDAFSSVFFADLKSWNLDSFDAVRL